MYVTSFCLCAMVGLHPYVRDYSFCVLICAYILSILKRYQGHLVRSKGAYPMPTALSTLITLSYLNSILTSCLICLVSVQFILYALYLFSADQASLCLSAPSAGPDLRRSLSILQTAFHTQDVWDKLGLVRIKICWGGAVSANIVNGLTCYLSYLSIYFHILVDRKRRFMVKMKNHLIFNLI